MQKIRGAILPDQDYWHLKQCFIMMESYKSIFSSSLWDIWIDTWLEHILEHHKTLVFGWFIVLKQK